MDGVRIMLSQYAGTTVILFPGRYRVLKKVDTTNSGSESKGIYFVEMLNEMDS